MTTITGTTSGATNVFDSDTLEGVSTGTLGAHSATQFLISGSGFAITGVGTGFSYSGNHPNNGTITSLTVDFDGYASTWTGFSVSASSLWHAISTGDTSTFQSLLFGGNDTFNSSATNGHGDIVAGYAGDDVFNMGANFNTQDQIDGGTGNDTVNLNGDYSHGLQFFMSELVSVENLTVAAGHTYVLTIANSGATSGTMNIDASALGAANFLNFDGSSAGGIAFNVTGGAGNDVFRGGPGNDTFNGGAGNDVVSYFSSSTDMTINIGTTGPQTIGQGFGTDTLVSVEGVITGSGNDTITGDSHDNFIDAGSGNNTIDGGAGNDTVSYADSAGPISIDLSLAHQSVSHNDGTDSVTSVENVIGSSQNDQIIAGNNDNVIDGGFGGQLNDTLSCIHATSGVTIDYSAGTGTGNVTGGSGHDTITRIGNLIGSSFDDTLIVGADPSNQSGGNLPQTFNGGDGYDTVDLSHLTSGFNSNNFEAPSMTDVEHLIGTAFADQLSAPFGPLGTVTEVDGGDGNDQLIDNVNGAILHGDGGNDTIIMNATQANDRVDGGAGADTLILNTDQQQDTIGANVIANVETVQLSGIGSFIELAIGDGNVAAGQTMTVAYKAPSGQQAADVFLNVSAATHGNYILTTDAGSDMLTGGAGNDTFNSGAGADVIDISRGGDDIVHASSDNDTILAGAALTAKDQIDGGSGSDILNLAGDYSAGLTLGATTLTSVETLQLSAGNSYALTTNDANVAAGGRLTVDGSTLGVADTLSFNGSHESDGVFVAAGGAGNDTIIGGAGNDNLTGNSGDDVMTSGAGTDIIKGDAGNDTINMGANLDSTDQINGGPDNDTVVLAGDYSAGLTLTASMLAGVETLKLTGAFNYNLTAEAALLSGHALAVNGALLGASNSLHFDGSAETNGKFNITDGAGDDVLSGGALNDVIVVDHGGNDSVSANGGDDSIQVKAALNAGDTIDGGVGNDTLTLQGDYSAGVVFGAATVTGVETMRFAAGHVYSLTASDGTVAAGATMTVNAINLHVGDNLTYNGSAETDGAYALYGGKGNDTLSGGAGADVLDGAYGSDHLNGGGGADRFIYKHASESTGATFDTITGFDATMDKIDLTVPVHIDAVMSGGSLSAATFDADMTSALSHLSVHHAVLFTATAGDYAGDTFLVVNLDKSTGYHAGKDLVIMLDQATHLDSFGVGDFV